MIQTLKNMADTLRDITGLVIFSILAAIPGLIALIIIWGMDSAGW